MNNRKSFTGFLPPDKTDPIVKAARFALAVLVCALMLFWLSVGPQPSAIKAEPTSEATCA